MLTDEFFFDLPEESIAQNPTRPRDASRLMVLDRTKKSVSHVKFHNLTGFLKKGDVLVFNKSKVIPARIKFKCAEKDAEILLIRKLEDSVWDAMVKPGKLFKEGRVVRIDEMLGARVVKICEGGLRRILFEGPEVNVEEYLKKIGSAPYPPYIRKTNASFDDYQTVYAETEGSVAAPTAGLHFTQRMLSEIEAKGVETVYVTLHIGPGTFRPVKTDNVDDHKMHSEYYEIGAEQAEQLNVAKLTGKRIIAVGTTSVRVLESNFDGVSFHESKTETDIFIRPGYKWKCVDGLITNFHLPKSTLIMLVCAFGGKEFVLDAYKEAVKSGYRFYSFGDAMMVI